MKTTKKSQVQRLLAYLRKNKKGITTMEAFEHLRICCLHKRISELEETEIGTDKHRFPIYPKITRTRERTPGGATVTRYKLAR